MATTVTVTTTRSGRVIKKPVFYEPEEICEDDYSDEDEDDEDVDIIDDSECESEEYDDDEDADENGNLKGFVVDEESEEDEEDT
jgi:hypothetical protein